MGTATPNVVPHNHFPTRDGKWVAIACTSDRIFERLATAMGREDMASDPRYDAGPKRVENREEVDAIVSQWTSSFDMKELVGLLDAQEVPVSGITASPTSSRILNIRPGARSSRWTTPCSAQLRCRT